MRGLAAKRIRPRIQPGDPAWERNTSKGLAYSPCISSAPISKERSLA